MSAAPPTTAVIGAGFAGLAAAVELSRAGQQVSVFEARDRVGGRVWSQTRQVGHREVIIERGAEFVLRGYQALRAYCARYSLELVDAGMSYYLRENPELPGVTPATMAALNAQAAEVAAGLSRPCTVAELLDTLQTDPATRAAVQAKIEMSAGIGADQLDACSVFADVDPNAPTTTWRIGSGNQSLAAAMAVELGDHLTMSRPVTQVETVPEGIAVTTRFGREIFDRVIVAVPFVLLTGDALHIDLPGWKRAALGRLRQGNAAKLHIPLRSTPPATAVMSAAHRYWTWTAFDSSGTVAPMLNGFGGNLDLATLRLDRGATAWAAQARALRPDLDFADDEATVTAWHLDEWARGAYANQAPGFSAADTEALQRPVGSIFFAGEYTDPENIGLMEGALRSGRRAADEVLRATAQSRS